MDDFRQIDLPNQMKAYYIRMPNTHSVVISVFVRAGLRYESPEHFGVSHLIEHLLFRRLNDLEQRQLYYELECMGTTLRATTYVDFIRFYAEVLPQFAEKTFQIMEKIFHSGNWTAEDIRKEKNVVLNQINGKSLSFSDHSKQLYWAHSHLGSTIMGTSGKINRISRATIVRYYEKYFRPQNCAIVVSGNFNHEFAQFAQSRLCELTNKSIKKLPAEPVYPKNFCRRTSKDDFIYETVGEYANVRICFEAGQNKISKEMVQFLHSILGDGDGSRLSMLLREEMGIVDEIYSEFESHNGFSILSIQYDVTHDRLLETIELVFSAIVDLMREITNRDINASILFLTSNAAFDLDSPEQLNFQYGWRCFIQGEQLTQAEEKSNQFACVSAEELRAAAQGLFKSENQSAFIYCNHDYMRVGRIKGQLNKARNLLMQTER